ncbi:hypothetical protein OC846_000847 [Tilletia horrida]|uniref:Uncharacterized protein n=1 Tax=Tilletia horrida TaxID=155126 RepID=A0AAN6GXB5_9BASI|nr:hypothetical protein OC845_001198 [Tilletia horrida]KAK0556820.1 hypothetical protein OC846_000847 [Tilletia horrida]KAK0569243.1 hypothetical protein OC861_001169 [Tilletia horrida]
MRFSTTILAVAAAATVAMAQSNTTGLPTFSYTLLNETDIEKGVLCQQQTKYCAMSGCQDANANITINFCNNQTMASRCACGTGATIITQSSWPIEFADCRNRGLTCKQTCFQLQYASNLQSCQAACDQAYTATCATPGQIAADYSVMKQGDKPSYALITGGTAGTVPGAASLRMVVPSMGTSLMLGSLLIGLSAGVTILA